jgi:hypothetical protein
VNTVIINGEVVEMNSSGSINVVIGNSRVHIQQSVSSVDGSGSENVTIPMQNVIGASDALSDQIDALIAKILSIRL